MKTSISLAEIMYARQLEEEGTIKNRIIYRITSGSKELVDFLKYLYLVVVLIMLVCAVIELKHIFNVDLFPGVDTPFDNVYYAGKDKLNISQNQDKAQINVVWKA